MPKRFYKTVTSEPAGDGFAIKLDGRVLKTPRKNTLKVPTKHAAQLIVSEWEAQGDEIIPASMPCTRLLNVASEHTPETRKALAQEARAYAGTDLLCYRKNDPEDFAKRQAENWDPVLNWARAQGVKLKTTDSVLAIAQSEASLDAVQHYAETLSDVPLTLFVHLVSVFGSAVLAMAVMEKHLTGAQGFALSRLDESWQAEQWGEDEEAKANAHALAAEVDALCRLIAP